MQSKKKNENVCVVGNDVPLRKSYFTISLAFKSHLYFIASTLSSAWRRIDLRYASSIEDHLRSGKFYVLIAHDNNIGDFAGECYAQTQAMSNDGDYEDLKVR